VLAQGLAADPGGAGTGQFWFRTDTKEFRYYDGAAVRVLATLEEVVNSLAAGDGTIVLGGTAIAPTIRVAKVLDHTWITDFQATVDATTLDQLTAPAADVSFNNHKITNLADATNPQDAVNMRTLLNNVTGLSASEEVGYATAAALPANTYANGAAGVGATLTGNANGALVVDGVNPPQNARVLVTSEATQANNGIYTVTQTGDGTHPYVLTRAVDFNQANNVGPGILVPVKAPANLPGGAANDGKVYLSISKTAPVIGTDAITFSVVGGTYSAGNGLALNGLVFSLVTPVTIR